MSHATDYLTWMSRREVNSATGDEALRPDPLGRPLHGPAQSQGQRGAYLSAQRAAHDLLRLCLGAAATASQPLPTQAADKAE